ncbi:ribonuclease P protein component [Actinocrinis puniceicyclus]|uniref:Ribonuclease P protein component n=1 Tax=Actinocrinis puniceicyclus TaxID=977794 RepID=A0A8J7WIU6_9ACTN|nr:ribonuclease P protein component [Actinocrinis puniceicyclus]
MKRGEDFALAMRGGRRAGRSTLVAHLWSADLDTPEPRVAVARTGPARAGFVVSKAVGPAVTRNRVKRRLRHLVAARLDRLPGGSVLVVRALPPAAAAAGDELARDLDSALRRLGGSG